MTFQPVLMFLLEVCLYHFFVVSALYHYEDLEGLGISISSPFAFLLQLVGMFSLKGALDRDIGNLY